MLRDVVALMRPDAHAGPEGWYRVRSLYFDTPDYMAYHAKLSGLPVRHKVRARTYGVDPGRAASIRLEVKSRYLSFIHKLALDVPRWTYAIVQSAIESRTMPPRDLLDSGQLPREFFRVLRQYNMEPKVIVEYRRLALERREASRTRINLDDELVATRDLHLLGPLRGARRLLRPGHCILEIKVDGVLPNWLHTLIMKYDLQAQAISKYCYAVRSEARMTATSRSDELFPTPLAEAV